MANWFSKVAVGWCTLLTSSWFSDISAAWFKKSVSVTWDSILFDWDSLLADWDSIGANVWYTKNNNSWFNKN